VALAACWGATACVQPPGQAAPDAAAAPDAGPDAALADAGPDGAAPLRRLMVRRLFGTTPVENRFVDPTFSRVDGVAWIPIDYASYQLASVTLLHQGSPTGLPVLALVLGGGQRSATVMGSARSAAGPVRVSLWLGEPAPTSPEAPQVRLLGLYPGGEASVELTPDEDTPKVVLDDIRWTRWRADLDEGPLGWATLRVVHRDEPPLYLNGPVLERAATARAAAARAAAARAAAKRGDAAAARAATQTGNAAAARAAAQTARAPGARAASPAPTWRPVVPQPLTEAERVNLHGYWRRYHDRFRLPFSSQAVVGLRTRPE
jgi:hypothetical protein